MTFNHFIKTNLSHKYKNFTNFHRHHETEWAYYVQIVPVLCTAGGDHDVTITWYDVRGGRSTRLLVLSHGQYSQRWGQWVRFRPVSPPRDQVLTGSHHTDHGRVSTWQQNQLCLEAGGKSLFVINTMLLWYVISTNINTKMYVCLPVCSRFSRLIWIRLGYPLAQSCFLT